MNRHANAQQAKMHGSSHSESDGSVLLLVKLRYSAAGVPGANPVHNHQAAALTTTITMMRMISSVIIAQQHHLRLLFWYCFASTSAFVPPPT